MPVPSLSVSGALIRMAVALVLVLATFNPSGQSFYHWLSTPPVAFTPAKALGGLVLLIGWVATLRTTFIALGWLGVTLGGLLLATLLWLLVDRQLLDTTGAAMTWAVLGVVGLLLGVGLSWSLVRARVTGQVEVQ
ncbi:MAG: hypothetical protein HOP14_00010 [Acidobacteria bacterium]|nr:hypothetical protein [Acidobacteriota bacterium]